MNKNKFIEYIKKNSLKVFLAIFVLLSILDIITTRIAIINGLGYEANAFMQKVVQNIYMLVFIKILGVSAIVYLLYKIGKLNMKYAYFTEKVLLLGMTLIVLNNFIQISMR